MDRRLVAALLFLAAWGIYAAGAIPALYGGDSGELIASSAALGVSHAPGYPLHALAGKAAINALPFGGPALRVALSSAAFSALTVAILFLLLAARLAKPGFALLGAILYGSLPIVWDQAQTAEVFALNNLFAVVLLGLAPAALGRGARRRFALWCFLYGLAAANHQTIVLLLPGFAWLWAAPRWEGARSVGENLRARAAEGAGKVPAAALFGLLGASIYLFLFFRAAAHPPVNFGDPHTWSRFWAVITRKEFGTLELHPAAVPFRSVEVLWQQVRAYGRLTVATIGALPLAGGLIGFRLAREGAGGPAETLPVRPAGIVMRPYRSDAPRPLGRRAGDWVLFWLFSGPLFVLLSNLSPFNTLAQWRLERFQLLPALFLAAGCAALAQHAWSRRSLWLLVLLPAGLLVEQATAAPHPWFRSDLAFRDFGRNVAASLAPQSVLVIDRVMFDEPTSAVLNRLVVDRERPDLRPLYRPGTLFELFYGEDVLELPRGARLDRQADREAALWYEWRGPVAALAFVKENLPPIPMALTGLVYRTAPVPRMENFYVRRNRPGRPGDYQSRLIAAHYPYFEAKAGFESGDAAAASRAAAEAAFLGDDMEWLRSNLGSLWSRWSVDHAGEGLDRAAREFERAVGADPYFPQGQFGLGFARLQQKNYLAAIEAFSQAVRLRPDWPEAHYMLGLAYNSAGRRDAARAPWEKFLALDPKSSLAPGVRRALGNQ